MPISLQLYVLTYAPRLDGGVTQSTLDSIARSDWGEAVELFVQDNDITGDPRYCQTENYRRLLERVVAEAPDYALILEDDVQVNRYLRHNLEHWLVALRHTRDFSAPSTIRISVLCPLQQRLPMALWQTLKRFTVARPLSYQSRWPSTACSTGTIFKACRTSNSPAIRHVCQACRSTTTDQVLCSTTSKLAVPMAAAHITPWTSTPGGMRTAPTGMPAQPRAGST